MTHGYENQALRATAMRHKADGLYLYRISEEEKNARLEPCPLSDVGWSLRRAGEEKRRGGKKTEGGGLFSPKAEKTPIQASQPRFFHYFFISNTNQNGLRRNSRPKPLPLQFKF
jgi:hypothetical protein